MIFIETELKGAYIIDLEMLKDERGSFARTWCKRKILARGLNPELVQCNLSVNRRKGTWRGMHYQTAPHEEAKLVRCTRGAVLDVIVDLRSNSATYKKHVTVELNSENRRSVYVPERFAHGFLTLEDDTEVFYQMSEFHSPETARGFRWNDPSFGIQLPLEISLMSDRDRTYPDFDS